VLTTITLVSIIYTLSNVLISMFDKVRKMSNKPAQKNAIENESNNYANKQILSVSEAASILRISPTSLRRLEQENRIKSIRQPNGYRIFKLEEVTALKVALENEKKTKQSRQINLPLAPLPVEKVLPQVTPVIPQVAKHVNTPTHRFELIKPSLVKELKTLRKPILLGTVMTVLILTSFSLVNSKYGADVLGKVSIGNFLGLKDTNKGYVLSDKDLNSDFVFKINIPAIFKADTTVEQNLTVNGNLTVDQLSTLSGGLTTNNADGNFGTGTITVGIVNFVGAATLNNLAAIDEVTETTLEEALDINGDVTSTGMNNTVVTAINGVELGDTTANDSNILMAVDGRWTSVEQNEITSLGTITEGVWEGDPIAPEFGGLGITSFVTGDLIFADTNSTWSTMNVGGTGYILTSNGSTPQWALPSSLIADAWLLSGNTGTNPNLNFIGTTDSTGLSFRTNSVDRLRITENGFIGIGNTSPTVDIHLGNGSVSPTYISGVPESQFIEGDLEVAGTIYGSLIGVITTTGFDPNGIFFADATGTMVNDSSEITWNPTENSFTVNGTSLLNGLLSLSDGLSVTGPVNATGVINLGNGNNAVTINGSILTFNDNLTGPITFTGADGSFTSGDTAIVDAINAAYEAATGSGDGLWSVRSGALYPTNVVQDLVIGDSSSNAPFFFDTSANLLILTNSTSGASFRVNDQANDVTPFIIDGAGNVGIGTTNPTYKLEVIGDARLSNGSDLFIGTIGLNDNGVDNVSSGASLIGVFNEFTWSAGGTVQQVLNDLDAQIGTVAGNTHPALQLAGTANYLALNTGNQILTQSAIDLTNVNNTSGALLTSRGGLGFDASTAPAGSLLLGTGAGLNIRTMGGDATVASNGTLTLSDTGVSAATYGSAGGIPVLTVDSKGRIISASTVAANFEQTLTFSNPLTRTGNVISVDIATTEVTGTTASNSGLEIASDGLRLLGGCAANEILAWDAGANRWKCTSTSGIGGVTGTGVDGRLTFWNGNSSVASSQNLYWDNAQGRLAIGNSSPNYALDVTGDIYGTNLRAGTNLIVGGTALSSSSSNAGSGAYMIGVYDEFDFSNATNLQAVLNDLDAQISTAAGGTHPALQLAGTANYLSLNTGTQVLTQSAIDLTNLNNTSGALLTSRGGLGVDASTAPAGSLAIGTGTGFSIRAIGGDATLADNGTLTLANSGVLNGTYGSSTGIPVIQIDAKGRIISATTSPISAALDGTGITNYVARFLDQDTLDIGTLYDNGSFVGIGTTNPSQALDVTGAIRLGTVGLNNVLNTSAMGGAPTGNLFWGNRVLTDASNISNYAITSFTAGNGLTTTGTGPGAVSLALDVITSGTTGSTAANSGLELTADGLRLLGGCATNEVMIWDGVRQVWKCSSVSGVGAVTGSGSNGQVSFWNGTSNLTGNDAFFWNNATNSLGLGTTNPDSTLTISPTTAAALQINAYGAGAGNTGEFRFLDLAGSNYTGFKAPDSLTQNIVYTLPSTTAPSDYILTYQSGGVLQWKEITGVGAAGDITQVGSMTSNAVFADAGADDQWLGLGAAGGRIEFDDQTIDEVNILDARLGVGTTAPQYALDVNGDVRGVNLRADTALIVGGTSIASAGVNNVTSGASLIGTFDEFTYSNGTTVQAVLRDLDSYIGGVAGNTHPALQLTGTANYLSLNGANQILTQGAIDLTNTNNTSGTLLTSRGGLGFDASTAPSGTLLLGTGTGLNIRTMGGDATIASNGTLTLSNTGVIAGTYGSSFGIPVLQVDARGRIISASTALANFEQTLTFNNPLVRSGNSISLDVSTTGTTTTTASNSGLEIASDGLRLLGGCSSNEVLAWDAGANRWHCSSVSGVGGLTGAGTTNYLTKWSGANTLTSGLLYDDGFRIGLGTTNPTDMFHLVSASNPSISLTNTAYGTTGSLFNDGNLHLSGGGNLWLDGGEVYINSGNNYHVTVGSTVASARLDIKGLGTTDGLALAIKDSNSNYTFGIQDNGYVGVGTTDPDYALDVVGTIAASTNLMVGGTALSSSSSNAGSGAYMIGVYDEFDFSNNTNVQAVLNDLDAQLATLGAGTTHPALQLAGTANYLSLNGTQVLTQGAIDLTNVNNTSGALLPSRGGLGVDSSTAPAGTLAIGTGTGFNIRAMGGDATIASNGTLTLANTGVSAATYGSALGIPVIQVDAKGRIISASTALANFEQTLTFNNPLTRTGNTIGLDVTTTGTTATTASNSGLEIGTDGLRLLGGCSSNEVLAWDAGANRWKCASTTGIGAITGSGVQGQVAFWNSSTDLTSSSSFYWDNAQGRLAVGNTDPNYELDVTGDIFATNIRAGTNLIVGGTALSSFSSNAGSGAYMIGVNDEFGFSNATNVQAVLNDLDANFVNYALAANTHPALQLAGTSNYLSLNTGTQVLTQSAIDLTNAINTSGALLTSRGGLGIDASTAPAGTLVISTGSGFNIKALGGDATIASNGTFTLSTVNSNVGTFGSALGIPVLNIDAKGRILSATTALANFEQTLSFSNPIIRTGNAISLDVITTGTSSTTASNSGLEIGSDGLRLLGGCASNEVLAWDAGANRWKCSTTSGLGGVIGSGVAGRLTFWNGTSSVASNEDLFWNDTLSRLGIGNSNPNYALDVTGDVYATNIRAGTNVIVGGTALSATLSNAGSGAYLVGVFDEFVNSDAINVQGVLKDLDSYIAN
jgi:hypothetical protein